jgi:hypothetical protein
LCHSSLFTLKGKVRRGKMMDYSMGSTNFMHNDIPFSNLVIAYLGTLVFHVCFLFVNPVSILSPHLAENKWFAVRLGRFIQGNLQALWRSD